MMGAALGFVDLLSQRAQPLAPVLRPPQIELVHSDVFAMKKAEGGNHRASGEGKGHSAACTGEHTMSLADTRRLACEAYLSAWA